MTATPERSTAAVVAAERWPTYREALPEAIRKPRRRPSAVGDRTPAERQLALADALRPVAPRQRRAESRAGPDGRRT